MVIILVTQIIFDFLCQTFAKLCYMYINVCTCTVMYSDTQDGEKRAVIARCYVVSHSACLAGRNFSMCEETKTTPCPGPSQSPQISVDVAGAPCMQHDTVTSERI